MSKFGKKKKDTNQEQKLTWQQRLVDDLRDLVYVLAGFMVIYMLFFRSVVVVGPSMYSTLKDGDRLLLLSSVVYREPKQGDIIVASKESFRHGECIDKRDIATEGQEVWIDFEAGVVYVDGIPLQEEYTHTLTTLEEGMIFPQTVPEGKVFVLGDNRDNSTDSRSPMIGFIDEREILGKAIFLIAPGSHYGTEEKDFGRIGAID